MSMAQRGDCVSSPLFYANLLMLFRVRWYADGYEMPVLGVAFMKEGNLEAARMLLDAGADVNAKFK